MILSLINEPPLLAEQKLVHEEQIMITEGTQLHTKWKKVLVHEKQIPRETQFQTRWNKILAHGKQDPSY